jgi:uncharacterized protein
MQVKDIYVYPIKSLGGIRVSAAGVLDKGFAHDRRWMLVDNKDQFMTQRKIHHMALLQVEMLPEGLKVFHKQDKDMSIIVPYDYNYPTHGKVHIWDDEVSAFNCGKEINGWFSEVLAQECKLVHMKECTDRKVKEKYRNGTDQVSFADAMPFLLIGQASLEDLNGRLESPIGMERFRPNLVVEGTQPFEEDRWKEIYIGKIRFKITKPCARCVVTTVDQSSGKKGKEPLATLAAFRNFGGKVLFGQNLVACERGEVRVGDPLTMA